MYEAYYNLRENPFGITPDPRFLYKSRGHRESLAYLAYGLFGRKGFLAIIGEVGIGKTTVIRAFIRIFHPCLEVAFVLNTKVNFNEMLRLILMDFGCEIRDESKVGMLSTLNDFLVQKFARNQNPVIVIDEAQNLSPDVLEELRMLSNLETDQQKLVQIVLVGQPELAEVLDRGDLRQLRQRIPGVLRMRNLGPEEVEHYILFRLRVAGMENGHLTFTSSAMRAIYEESGGIPRLVNQICERVMVRGYLKRTLIMDREIVYESIGELFDTSSDELERSADDQ